MKSVILVRHAETEANAAGVWQGHGDAGLTDEGRSQAKALGERLAAEPFSLVVASDLRRAVDTAGLAGFEPDPRRPWREMDIGEWEGLTREEVFARYPDDMEALAAGEERPMGGGETWSEFGSRARAALDAVVAEMDPGGRALVLTHGGMIHAVVAAVLGIGGRRRGWPVDRVANTGITEILFDADRSELRRFNDATHLGGTHEVRSTLVALIRHGESEANRDRRWHGRSDGPLSADGERQAMSLSDRMPRFDGVYTSPAERARRTAEPLAARSGIPLDVLPGLAEMDFGQWEGMTAAEIMDADPGGWDDVFVRGNDLPRGGTGERFAETSGRGRQVVDTVASLHPGERVGVVTHGVLIRAVVADVLGMGWPAARRLGIVDNAGVAHLRYGDSGPVLVDYNT